MILTKLGQVIEVIEESNQIVIAKVLVDGEMAKAIHFPGLSGPLRVGDRVRLNTTAKSLHLGTGGYHFILHVEGNDELDTMTSGHIMKLRYTPYQIQVLSVEEEDSPHHQTLVDARVLAGMPVIVAPLHSMVTPISAVLKTLEPDVKIAYLMSDGAALPMAFSRTVKILKERGWLTGTITFGHAFGGDLEAVNIYSALLAARWVLKADVAIVAMGPGIVGTGTPLGFSGVEQADYLHAAHVLQGEPVAVPRISFADARPRHQGISHHSQTVLGKLTLVQTQLAVPALSGWKGELLTSQLQESGIFLKHKVKALDVQLVEEIVQKHAGELSTMGRGYKEEEEFFLTAGLAGVVALRCMGLEV